MPAFAPLPCLGSIAIVAVLFASVLSIWKVPVSGVERECEPTFARPFQVTVIVCVWPGCKVNDGAASLAPLDFQTSLKFWLAVKLSRSLPLRRDDGGVCRVRLGQRDLDRLPDLVDRRVGCQRLHDRRPRWHERRHGGGEEVRGPRAARLTGEMRDGWEAFSQSFDGPVPSSFDGTNRVLP